MFFADLHILWAHAQYIYALPLLVGALVMVWSGYYFYKKRISLLTSTRYASLMIPSYSPTRFFIKGMLWSIALICLFVAVLRPQWGKKETLLTQEGRDVMVILDISRSMLAEDMKPTRLAFVKLKIKKLLKKLSYERLGLLLFSSNAYLHCPLTSDYRSFEILLDNVTTESFSSGTTAIGKALEKSLDVLGRSGKNQQKLMLLITDGEDFASNISALTPRLKKEKATICAWGVGTQQGAPVPRYNRAGEKIGYEKDSQGKLVLTKLNQGLLDTLTTEVGGVSIPVTFDDQDIARTVSYFDSFSLEKVEERSVEEYHDRYPIFLAGTWLSLLLELVL